jgi:hypothetical protein
MCNCQMHGLQMLLTLSKRRNMILDPRAYDFVTNKRWQHWTVAFSERACGMVKTAHTPKVEAWCLFEMSLTTHVRCQRKARVLLSL